MTDDVAFFDGDGEVEADGVHAGSSVTGMGSRCHDSMLRTTKHTRYRREKAVLRQNIRAR
jgi:hypothetical protein